MSTSTAIPLAYRCSKCWQLTSASSEQVGQSVPCISCSTPVVVPEATPKTIEAGEEFAATEGTNDQAKIELAEANLSDEQINALARQTVKQQIRQEAEDTGSYEMLGCSRWKRFIGSVIDSLAGGASMIVGFILASLLAQLGGGETDNPAVFLVVMLVPGMLAICQCYMIAVEGRTIGKYCVKSKIVNLQGKPPGFFQGIIMRIVVIGFLGMIPFFGMVNALWIFSEPKRCLHDLIAGTYVIDA